MTNSVAASWVYMDTNFSFANAVVLWSRTTRRFESRRQNQSRLLKSVLTRAGQVHHRWALEAPMGHGPDRLSWWSQTGSNRRPPACKAGALPTELWPLPSTSVVGLGRVELPTSPLSGVRSNQLSYRPRLRVLTRTCVGRSQLY